MSSFAPIARTPIATLAALVEGFQYPNVSPPSFLLPHPAPPRWRALPPLPPNLPADSTSPPRLPSVQAHKAAMAAAQLGVAPTRGPSTRGHHRIVSYELNDDFENLFDHEALFFFDADCFRVSLLFSRSRARPAARSGQR